MDILALMIGEGPLKSKRGFLEVDPSTNLGAQLVILEHKVNMWEAKMNAKQVLYCGLCKVNHHMNQCHLTTELVNFVGNFGRHGNFNAGWRSGNTWNHQDGAQWG